VTVDDFVNAKISYRMPFTRDELRIFLQNETVFKRHPQVHIDLFIKNFYPEKD
jgi:hypothetical protein